MKEFLKERFRNLYNMAILFGGDLFTRLVVQSNHDEFPKYYWLCIAVLILTTILERLEEKK